MRDINYQTPRNLEEPVTGLLRTWKSLVTRLLGTWKSPVTGLHTQKKSRSTNFHGFKKILCAVTGRWYNI
ncbi:hypothetical protein RhiirA5_423137 [Rhizophagus irregularis]|uniref:Uncharacterized protein n=1 Tax=Rhizophagus irregularis TaxID=588596 RepID=A0A2N0PAM1_9GLOM|nr:hypothetical protein RhiirA5_423137 [Rhizophagus irregularis]